MKLFKTRFILALAVGSILAIRGGADDNIGPRLARLPASDQLPFSFQYGGKDSNDLLKQWRHSGPRKEENEHYTRLIDTWTDPETKLEVRREQTRYTKYPVVEWTLHFTNNGNKP